MTTQRKNTKRRKPVSSPTIKVRLAKPPPTGGYIPISSPASLSDLLSITLPAGQISAFIFLGYLPKPDPRLDQMLAAFRMLPEAEQRTLNVEALCAEHGIAAWEFLMWVVGAVTAMGGNASQLIINSMKFPVTKASLERALNDPEEAKEWQRSWGHFVVPQKATVVVNASASAQAAAGASAIERGLPSFVDTTDEAEDALNDDELLKLPESSAVAVDVPFTVREKEIANVRQT